MTGRVGTAWALVVLVFLAGCAGPLGNPIEREDGTTATVTPQPVPSPEGGAGRPPGVTGAMVDTGTVLRADDRIRASVSYRVERQFVVETPNGSAVYNWTLRVAPDGRRGGELRTRGHAPFDPVFDRTSFWGNDTTLVARSEANGSEPVVTTFRDSGRTPYRPGDGLVPQAFSAVEPTVDSADGGGTVLRSAEPFRLPAGALPVGTEPTDTVTLRATVSPNGLVRSVRVRYRTNYGDLPIRVTLRERTTAVGETNVTRPPWLE